MPFRITWEAYFTQNTDTQTHTYNSVMFRPHPRPNKSEYFIYFLHISASNLNSITEPSLKATGKKKNKLYPVVVFYFILYYENFQKHVKLK